MAEEKAGREEQGQAEQQALVRGAARGPARGLRVERSRGRWWVDLGAGAALNPVTGGLGLDPDLSLASRGMPVEINFYYYSQDDYNAEFGYGRTLSYNRFLQENVPSAGKVTVHVGTGERRIYTWSLVSQYLTDNSLLLTGVMAQAARLGVGDAWERSL